MHRAPWRSWVLVGLLVLAPTAVGQSLTPTASARLAPSSPDPGPIVVLAHGTAVVPFTLTLDVAGFPCLQDAVFTVPLVAWQENGTEIPSALYPDTVQVTVPPGSAQTGTTQTVAVTLAIGPAPADTMALVHLVAQAPEGGCPSASQAERTGDETTVRVTWLAEPAPPPDQSMPTVPLVQVLAVLCFCLIRLRYVALNTRAPK